MRADRSWRLRFARRLIEPWMGPAEAAGESADSVIARLVKVALQHVHHLVCHPPLLHLVLHQPFTEEQQRLVVEEGGGVGVEEAGQEGGAAAPGAHHHHGGLPGQGRAGGHAEDPPAGAVDLVLLGTVKVGFWARSLFGTKPMLHRIQCLMRTPSGPGAQAALLVQALSRHDFWLA